LDAVFVFEGAFFVFTVDENIRIEEFFHFIENKGDKEDMLKLRWFV